MNAESKILDPFKILGIERGASHSDVKKAYQRRVKQYHPDKGGTAKQTQLIERAYKQIVHDFFSMPQKPVQNTTYDANQYPVPQIIAPSNFNPNSFHSKFQEHRQSAFADHNIYNVDPSQYVPRDKASYEREHNAINGELGRMNPQMDPRKRFDPTSFNKAYQESGGESLLDTAQRAQQQHAGTDGSLINYQAPVGYYVSQASGAYTPINEDGALDVDGVAGRPPGF